MIDEEKDTFEEMLEFLNLKQKKRLLEVIYLIEHKVKEDYKSFVIKTIKEIIEWADNRQKNNIIYRQSSEELNNEWLDKIDELLEVLEK